MRKTILIVLAVLAAVVVVFAVVAAMQPADFRVERSTIVAAPPDVVFEHVNDFRKWEAWSPWAQLDPNMKTTYSGEPAGVGAEYAWAGNGDVGEGRMTIVESEPGELVRIKLEFLKPFAATHTADFTFEPQGAKTLVTWSMHGKNDFLGKVMSVFMDMDSMVGPDFEKGLEQLKEEAEKD
jgi:hypothetical protein